jgi:nucleotide-binding universal stress UspA family protein
MRRILVATDFSESSLAALRYATALTYAVNGEGILLHVVEGEPIRRYVVGRQPEAPAYGLDLMANVLHSQVSLQGIQHDLCEEAHWKLSALLPPALQHRFRTLVVVGRTCEEILRVARNQRIDLIMLGERSRGGIASRFRRSLAEQVGRLAAIPVLTVRNPGRVISDQEWLDDSLLWEWPTVPQRAKPLRARESSSLPKKVPLATAQIISHRIWQCRSGL